jgi:hypothetical protein
LATNLTTGNVLSSTLATGYTPLNVGQTYVTDLNNDGNSDLVILGASYPFNGSPVAQPSLVAFGDGKGGFTLASQATFPYASLNTIHPREVVFADFNGDGYKDMFVASHGFDASPYPGEQNQLFLSNGNGTWRNATATLPQVSDFTHSASVGDVNGDGTLDILVGNVPQPNPVNPYVLLNNGAGVFTRSDSLLPTQAGGALAQDTRRMTSDLLVDLDGDGRVDLVAGAGFSSAANPIPGVILWNQNGSYAQSASTALPFSTTFGAATDIYDIQAVDVNFDGLMDLVVNRQTSTLGGWELQVLVNQGGRNFVDATTTYLPDPASRTGGLPNAASAESQYWVQFINVADINGDGRMDFTLDARGSTGAPATFPVAYIHQADGTFAPVKVSDVAGAANRSLFDFSTQYITWQGGSGYVHVSASADGKVQLDTLPVTFAPILPLVGNQARTFTGGAGADTFTGGDGNDTFTGSGGNDTLDGGAARDTAVYAGARANFTITRTATGYTVTDKTGAEGTDTLLNIERLQFADAKVAIDVAGNGGEAYRLYQAAFNRTPDKAGLGYHIGNLDKGISLHDVALGFVTSPEFASTYGNLDNTGFVTQLYQNVLHRAPEAAGLAYHVGNLASGASRADVLIGFSESAENQTALIGVIQNGMEYAALP